MAKTESGASGETRDGMPSGFRSGKVPRGAKRTTLIPLTPAPKTRAAKVARALWG